MVFGKKKSGRDVPHGDKMTSKQAKTATGSGGGIRADGTIVNPRGKKIGSVAGRRLKERNQNDV